MYSVVMVAAMTVAPATPDWGFKQGGCYGCNGGGCWGSSCYGCSGGGCWGSSCNGCSGGCWGSGCHGGGFCGFCGGGGFCGLFSHGCHGSTSCNGCYGGGCCGGGYPVAPYASLAFSGCSGAGPYYTGCMGYGSYYTPAGPYGVASTVIGGTYVTPAGGYVAPVPVGSVDTGAGAGSAPAGGTGAKSGTGSSGGGAGSAGGPGGNISVPGVPERVGSLPANRAQVVVLAPASAKLYAEGEATSLTGTERVFLTPELSAGRDFQYTLKVENGTESTSKQVVVRAGHRTVVDFNGGADRVSTPVMVNLPAKAKLFVDGVPAAVTGGTHTLNTPELVKGKAFTYEFRAEVDKDGTTEVVSKKVTFTAGEPVTVDFVEPTAVRTASR